VPSELSQSVAHLAQVRATVGKWWRSDRDKRDPGAADGLADIVGDRQSPIAHDSGQEVLEAVLVDGRDMAAEHAEALGRGFHHTHMAAALSQPCRRHKSNVPGADDGNRAIIRDRTSGGHRARSIPTPPHQ
jgi:hypothetical protein